MLKPAPGGGYTIGHATADQFVRTPDASTATLYGQLNMVQQLQQQQNLVQQQNLILQQQQNLAQQQQQNLAQQQQQQQQQSVAQTQQNYAQSLMLQRLFQQSGMVVSRLPSLSAASAGVDQQQQALYALPAGTLGGSTLQLVLGSQLKAEPGSATGSQFVVVAGGRPGSNGGGGASRKDEQPLTMDSLSAAQMMMMLQQDSTGAAASESKVKMEAAESMSGGGVQMNQPTFMFRTSVSPQQQQQQLQQQLQLQLQQQQQVDTARSVAQLLASQANAANLVSLAQYTMASSGERVKSEAEEAAGDNGELTAEQYYNEGNGEMGFSNSLVRLSL